MEEGVEGKRKSREKRGKEDGEEIEEEGRGSRERR